MHPTRPSSPEITSTRPQPTYPPSSTDRRAKQPPSSDSPDELTFLPSINPSSSFDDLKRTPTNRSTGVPSASAGLERVTTVELAGKTYLARPGRGEEIGEPLADTLTREEITYIDWPEGDPENPFNYSSRRKWAYTFIGVFMSSLTAVNATSYSSGIASAGAELGVSRFQWLGGTTAYLGVMAVAPLLLAPLSEVYGRNKIYIVTSFLSAALFIPQALSPTIGGIIVARAFQGASGSISNSLIGGTIADMFLAKQRGLPMSVFTYSVFLGQSIGPSVFGYVCQLLGYQWMFWIQAIVGFVSFAITIAFMRETRGSVLLARRADALTKATGKLHAAPGDKERTHLRTLISVSCTRPILYLLTEPIVLYIATWLGVCWASVFLFISSVSIVFGDSYGFSTGQTGLVFISIGVGASIGFCLNLIQERLYRRAVRRSPTGKAEPEARLYLALVGAFAFPVGVFIYAWTGRAGTHWIWPTLALTLVNVGIFLIYSAVFSYLGDAYERYSSSAQAAQSLLRNVFAGCFPLFSTIMYTRLTPPIAGTLVACVTLVLGFCPAVLIVFGKRLRARSKVASALLKEQLEEDEKRLKVRARQKNEVEMERRKLEVEGAERMVV